MILASTFDFKITKKFFVCVLQPSLFPINLIFLTLARLVSFSKFYFHLNSYIYFSYPVSLFSLSTAFQAFFLCYCRRSLVEFLVGISIETKNSTPWNVKELNARSHEKSKYFLKQLGVFIFGFSRQRVFAVGTVRYIPFVKKQILEATEKYPLSPYDTLTK